MSAPSLSREPDEVAQLRAEVAALRGDLQRHTAPAAARPPRRRLPRRFLPLALVALLVVLTPLATFAANPFNDLTGGVHDPNIDLIYNAGITTGCVPNVSYCPTDNVTREQMASFLARTAGLGTNPPVVNAKTAQTATNATNAVNATNATNAGNANTVGGLAPNGLVRVAGASQGVTNITPSSTLYTPIVSVDITAPGPGYVLINAATSMFSIQPTGYAFFRVTDGTILGPSHEVYVGVNAGYQTESTVGTTYVFPVTAAGAKTFRLEARQSSVGGLQAFRGQITALYVPFGAAGASASSLDIPAAQPEPDVPQSQR